MRTFPYSILIILITILVHTPVVVSETETAEAPAADAGLEAMSRLGAMVGQWRGSGWMRRGPGEPSQTISRETVEYRLDGRILVVEGLHHSKDDPSQVVHHAFGVISHDPESGGYRFQTHLANGRSGVYEMRLEDDDILWFLDSPRGKIRYTIRIRDGEWREIGEFSADGENWQQFFGMDLEQVTD